jgi:Putative MetA-pathway of phenol degradation
MRSWPILLVLAGLALTAPLAAQEQPDDAIDTDRPDFTDGTGIIPKGLCQVETGYTFSRVKDGESSSFGEVLVRIPIAERVEARLGVNSYDWLHGEGTKAQGLEDPSVGVKIRLTDDAEKLPPGHPEIALLFITTVPVGGKEITADVWQPTVKLALSRPVTKRFSLSANADYSYLADGGRRFSQAAASLSARISLTGRLDAYVETFGRSKETAGGSWTQYVDSGLSYTITPNLKVDVRAGTGLNHGGPNYFVGAGGGVRW